MAPERQNAECAALVEINNLASTVANDHDYDYSAKTRQLIGKSVVTASTPLRVVKIHVTGLFGIYNHTVTLNKDDRVTIIHGPNGVGKTVLLRVVYSLFSGRFQECLRTSMDQLEVTLSDGAICGIRPAGGLFGPTPDSSGKLIGSVYLKPPAHNGAEPLESPISFDQKELGVWATRYADESRYLVRIDQGRWLDRRDDAVYTSIEMLNQNQDRIPDEVRARIFTEPPWFIEIRKRVGVHIIETQRLLKFGRPERAIPTRSDSRELISTVKEYARDLSRRIKDAQTNYARVSQRLDQSFPRRLLEGPQDQFSVPSLKTKMEEIEKSRQRLTAIGLIDAGYVYPFNTATLDNVDPTKQSAMTLYVNDTDEKLGVFDDLSRRIETLITNVNEKFRNTKIVVSGETGLVALTKSQQKLDLDSLSSGEQHELVLLYDLLFRVKPNTLILIDEPELSLHITWQKRFLSDLLEIVRISDCDVLLATHSIFVAGDRPDLMVALTRDDNT